ncbi:uncharacterized protein TRIVIDRAFT_53223 [Trichoderma virens Gv29-8]|uniref:amidase n=1 Tax=Hypocrea virens (strain Gv29-8 / FGSC 10586) TaxID=413071 RepID=G9MUV5_HYPVG|nr:uncharacterized protein TRIVIDRAFT_53223 [Trichoderma virens Gv29-8]EHK21770.1 hypothetical protein TRIVIDRAFT_53223 [Trichoderma virens Gv29-8]UKZ51033.1 hypothetical protein TrVGV298_004788 [Trichoderma virens]
MTDWETRAREHANDVNARIPEKWVIQGKIPTADEQRDVTGYIRQFLTAREIRITETEAIDIVANIASGTWKAKEVTEAFCHRAALAHQLVHCLHEIFFAAAISDAEKLDDYFERTGQTVGPLHGLPVSLKDQFHVRGVETTMGYVGWLGTFEGREGTGKEKVFESEMARELRNLGAVFYIKTSVPQTLVSGETFNNFIGYTNNPKNRHLSAGGSSGGEGALIALKGSPVGFGTDIAGSIRMPASANGIYGLKPSAYRLPYEGVATSLDGQNTIQSSIGPLAPCVGAMRLLLKNVLASKPWLYDPQVVELPYRDELEQCTRDLAKRRLVFGILDHDGVVTPHPPVARAMGLIRSAIEDLGHGVLEWKPPAHSRAVGILVNSLLYDGGQDVHKNFRLSGERIFPQITGLYGETPSDKQQNATDIAANNVLKREYQKEYLDYWNGTAEITGTGRPVDAWILPAAPFTAARPGRYDWYGYTAVTNVLDYTTAVVPVTTANKDIDLKNETYTALNDWDRKVWESYDAEIYDGAPVAVQIVGRRFEEEKILVLAEVLDEALGRANS